MKICGHCKHETASDQFYSAGPNRLHNWCKSCCRVRARETYHADKEQARDRHLRKKYGISSREYDRIFAIQNGKCALCGSTKGSSRTGYLFVDHNHRTGEVRSLLCSSCNTGLGLFRDNSDLLRAAARYVDNDG